MSRADRHQLHALSEPTIDKAGWQPQIFNLAVAGEEDALADLLATGHVGSVADTILLQLRDLVTTEAVGRTLSRAEREQLVQQRLDGSDAAQYGRWIYYPWLGRIVHLLPPDEFRRLRLNRNANKITPREQARLARQSVGVVGLSVGNAVALTLALEGVCGHLKLADFDTLELSNMNRVRAGISDIGLPKAVVTARQIAELDPYLPISLFPQGVTADTIDAFVLDTPRLDVLVDECDDLAIKVLLRERARALRLPVVMETSDRGMLDIERFDVEPDRPLFHGLVGPLSAPALRALSRADQRAVVLRLIGEHTISRRLRSSLAEIDRSLVTWPQLGSEVTLGGASVTAAVRRLGLGQALPSGRRYVDIAAIVERTPEEHHAGSPAEHGE